MAKTNKPYFESRWVMILHAGMTLGVIVQLVSSQLMHSKIPNAVDFFYLHRLSGVWTFVMVVLGIVWWIMRAWQVGAPSDARLFIHWHEDLATLLWIYIGGHVVMG